MLCAASGQGFSPITQCFSPADQIDEDAGQEVLLRRLAFGNEERHGDEGRIGDALGAVGVVEGFILFQEPQEEGGADALVAVHERMVFNEEIEKMGRLLLDTGVEILAAEGLHDRPERASEAVILCPSAPYVFPSAAVCAKFAQTEF